MIPTLPSHYLPHARGIMAMEDTALKIFAIIGGVIVLLLVPLFFLLHRGSSAPPSAWGYAAPNGVTISAQAQQPQYELGQPMRVAVYLKNTSRRVVRVPFTGDSDFRLALFDGQGQPVPKTEWAINTETAFGIGGPVRHASKELAPGQIFPDDIRVAQAVDLARWFDIPQAGTYRLVILRAMGNQPHNFAISNMETIEVK